MIDVLIIGGGASALSCAIELKRNRRKLNVTIVERLDKVAKKILATGNGRCNLSNENISAEYYHSQNREFLSSIDYNESIEIVQNFFNEIGILLRKENGRLYPYSNQASTVQEIFKEQIKVHNINVIYDFECNSIKREKDYYLVSNGEKELKAEKVVIATGGNASSALGSNGSGYKLAGILNHKVTKVSPGLVQLKIRDQLVRDLKGQRTFARVTLYKEKAAIESLDGEILFTEYGLSGICIMDLSSLIHEGKYYIGIDLMREYSVDDIRQILTEKSQKMPNIKMSELLNGIINTKIGYKLMSTTFNNLDREIYSLNASDKKTIAKKLKNWIFTVDEKLSFENAQVTCGGIDTKEIDPKTFESKLHKNLYIIGEVLDVDGMCGGYNLHFAWYSGITSARGIVKE